MQSVAMLRPQSPVYLDSIHGLPASLPGSLFARQKLGNIH